MGGRFRAAALVLMALGAIGFTGAGLRAADRPRARAASPAAMATAVRRPTVTPSYVGTVHTAVPQGVTEVAGMVVADRAGALTDYAVSFVQDGWGDMLWLSRLSYSGGSGVPTARVLDVVRLPPLRLGEAVALADCVDGAGRPLPDSAAIFDETLGIGLAHLVWRADPQAGALVPMAAAGLSCGYGDEGV